MSLGSRMRQSVSVYSQAVEPADDDDIWEQVSGLYGIPMSIEPLNTGGSRRQMALQDLGATHTGRTWSSYAILAGHRVRDLDTDAEWDVKHVETVRLGGSLFLNLALVEAEPEIEL